MPDETLTQIGEQVPETKQPHRADQTTVSEYLESLLVTVITPAAGPKPVGAKRIGKSSESPGPINNGNDRTSGARNAADDDVTADTVTGQWPLLLSKSG